MNNVDVSDVLDEMNRQFPKELTICIQAVQIRKLQERVPAEEPDEG